LLAKFVFLKLQINILTRVLAP